MDPVDQASWLSATPALCLALALLFVPGIIVAKGFRLDWVSSIGVAPALGLFALLASATLAAAAGLRWTAVVGGVLIALVTLVLAVAGRRTVREPLRDDHRVTPRQLLAFGLASCVAAAVMTWQFVSGTRTPDALAQMPDSPFHLITVRDLVAAQSGSPWVSGETIWYVPGSRYPGGFHSFAATVASWSGTDVDVACHAVLLVLTAVVWPVSMIVLAWAAVARSGWLMLATAALTVATTFSAMTLMPVGAPWANAASTALLPSLLVPLALATRRATAPPRSQVLATIVLSLVMTVAAALCQPNAAFALALLGLPLIGPRVVSWGRWWAVAWTAAVAVVIGAWIVLFPRAQLDVPVFGEPDLRRGVLLVLKGGDLPMWAGAVVVLLMGIGLLASLTRRSQRGVALAWVAGFVLLATVALDTGFQVQRLAWPWYSGQARVAPVFAVPAILAAACGVLVVLQLVQTRAQRLVVPVMAVLVVALAVVALPAASLSRDAVRAGYEPADQDFVYVTDDEVADLELLASRIPADGATALDPFRGGMYLGMFGRRTIPVVPFSTTTEQGELIDSDLDAAAQDDAVCSAVRDLGVTNVLVGGSRAKTFSFLDPTAPGIDAVPDAAGFTEVATSGPYTLYEVPTACR